MSQNITALERAFQLAESGECDSVPDLKKQLQAEGVRHAALLIVRP